MRRAIVADENNLAVAEPAQVESPSEPPAYVMPPIAVGDTAIWHDSGDIGSPGYVGTVVKVDQFSITMQVLRHAFPGKESVRHVSDPKLRQNDIIRAFGGWDYSQQMKREMAMAGKIVALEAKVNELLDVIGLTDPSGSKKKK